MRRSPHFPGALKVSTATSMRSNHTQTQASSFTITKRQPINHLYNLQKEATEKNMSDRITPTEYQLLRKQESQANALVIVMKGSIALHAVTFITAISNTVKAGLCYAFNVGELSLMVSLTDVFILNTGFGMAAGVVGCIAGYRADRTYQHLQKKLL
jgi:hypothetical protein